jgi:hypothetical protein
MSKAPNMNDVGQTVQQLNVRLGAMAVTGLQRAELQNLGARDVPSLVASAAKERGAKAASPHWQEFTGHAERFKDITFASSHPVAARDDTADHRARVAPSVAALRPVAAAPKAPKNGPGRGGPAMS